MPPRQRQRRCRNCPEPAPAPTKVAAEKAAAHAKDSAIDPKLLTVDGEANRLWNHVLFGAGTLVGMLRGYTDLNMPGDPLPGLHDLRDRLNEIITLRERHNASSHRTNG